MAERVALVVPGATVRVDGSPSEALRLRLEAALELAQGSPTALVFVSGGAVAGPTEGPAMARWLVEQGLAAERIVVEAEARSTTENADRLLPLLRAHRMQRAIVISQRWHVLRTRFNLRVAARRAAYTLALEMHPVSLPATTSGRYRWALAELVKLFSDAACRAEPRLAAVLQGRRW